MEAGPEEWKFRMFLKVHCPEDRIAHVDQKRYDAGDMPMASLEGCRN